MRICSVTITSRTREKVIGDCIKSVLPICSDILIIHLFDAEGDDNTLGVARQIAGKRLKIVNVSVKTPWPEVRNKALEEADYLGADWALMLDTDERLIENGVDIRKALEEAPADVEAVDVYRVGGNEQRTKFFRLPAQGRFRHLYHEEYTPINRIDQFVGVRFSEVGKGSKDRSVEIALPHIERQMKEDPQNPRWRFYKAWMLEHDGKLYDAIDAYETVGNPILAGWCRFRTACCFAKLGEHEQALEECCKGLAFSPTHAELPWLAGVQALQMGEPENALAWAKMAAGLSWCNVPEEKITRRGQKFTRAFYEGPFEVMAMAYRALGDEKEAAKVDNLAQTAKETRLAVWGEVE